MIYGRPLARPDRWSPATRAALAAAGLDEIEVAVIIDLAFAEDYADGPDVTTRATVPADAFGTAALVSREQGIVAGGSVAAAAFESVGSVQVRPQIADGESIGSGDTVLTVSGRLRDLVSAERTALNLLSHLSGIATATGLWVAAVAGTQTKIRDSRKTLPGLRALQKYAVRCGGGVNHRFSLGDAALIKDNHVVAAGSVTAAIAAVRAAAPALPLEVEVDSLAQLDEALAAGVDLIMVDNFDLADTVEAVRRARVAGVQLEASGGLTLGRAATVAATGVDFLAVGALTHSSRALDIGMDL